MKSRFRMILPLLACALVSVASSVLADDLPKAGDVIHKFVEATGGEKAWKELTSYRSEGGFEMPAMGMAASVVTMGDVSGNSLMEIEIPGAGTQSQGVSGDVVWELSLMSGPRIMQGEEAAAAKRHADMLWFLDWQKHYTAGECVGVEEIGGEPCYRLELTTPDGSHETHFYSVESGLERQISMVVSNQMGEIAATTTIDEYGDYDGLKFPTKMRQSAAGMEQIITLTTFEKNPKFGPGVFELPEEIEALLEPAGN